MRISDLLSKRQKVLEDILAELKKINERPEIDLSVFEQLHSDLSDFKSKNAEFVEVIRHFFAIERTRKDAEDKRRAEEAEEAKPGKHDDRY